MIAVISSKACLGLCRLELVYWIFKRNSNRISVNRIYVCAACSNLECYQLQWNNDDLNNNSSNFHCNDAISQSNNPKTSWKKDPVNKLLTSECSSVEYQRSVFTTRKDKWLLLINTSQWLSLGTQCMYSHFYAVVLTNYVQQSSGF